MKLPFKIYSNEKFWRWKKRIQKIKFEIRKLSFLSKRKFNDEKEKIISTKQFIKETIWRCIKTLLFTSIFFVAEYIADNMWLLNIEVIPDWIQYFQKLIPKPIYPDNESAVIELVSVIASVSGVILALLYPVIATIMSSAYADVHASIRTIIIQEKGIQSMLRRLTYLTACAVSILMFMSFSILPGNLVLSFFTLFSLSTLFEILRSGMGIYSLFEPSNLAKIVLPKISDDINQVTIKGENFMDESFQSYYYKKADKGLGNLSLITKLCMKNLDSNESSYESITGSSLVLLNYYFSQKSKIPISSLWFPKIYNHKSYFEADTTNRGLSKETSSFIRPGTENDTFWFEEKVMDIISLSFRTTVSKGHITSFSETIKMFQGTLNLLSISTDIKTSKIIFNKFIDSLKLLCEEDTKYFNYDDWKEELVAIEIYCHAILIFQHNLFNRVTQFNYEKFNKEYKHIDWSKKPSLYETDYIPEIFIHLERFQEYVSNELYVEKKKITPDWYIKQAIAAEYLGTISEKIADCLKFFDQYIITAADYFHGKNPLLSSYISLIGLEALHKFNFSFNNIEKALEDIDKLETCKGEMRWTKPDFEELRLLINHYKIKCVSAISINIVKLSIVKWNSRYPDLFGQSYSTLSSELNKGFENNNPNIITQHFSPFLESALNASIQLKDTFKHYDEPLKISYQTIIDAMQISGYSYIYSIIYNKPDYWNKTKEAWDKLFNPVPYTFKLLVGYYDFYINNLNTVGINFNETTSREKIYINTIKKLGTSRDEINDVWVKYFYPDLDRFTMFNDPIELFFEIYVFTFVEAKEAAALLKRRRLFEKIVRYSEKM